jgi:hypothetical protein
MIVGLHQGYVMSTWLFNIFTNGVVNFTVNERGLTLTCDNGRVRQFNQIL